MSFVTEYSSQLLWGSLAGSTAVISLGLAILFLFKIQAVNEMSKFKRGALYALVAVLIIGQFALVFTLSKSVDLGDLNKTLVFALSLVSSTLVVGTISALFFQKFLD